MSFTRDEYELISSIEAKLESIKRLTNEGIIINKDDLKNVNQFQSDLLDIENKLLDIRKNSNISSDKNFNKYISDKRELLEIEKKIVAMNQVAASNPSINLNSTQSYIDLLARQSELLNDINQIESNPNFEKDTFNRYQKQNDRLNDIKSSLDEISYRNSRIINDTKEWNKGIDKVKNGYNEFIGNISKSFNILKQVTSYWRKQDEEITKMVSTFGLTSKEFKNYREASYKIGIDMARDYNRTQEDMVKLQQGYSETTGKNIILTKENYDSQFQLHQLMGDDNSLAFTSGIEQFGIGINDAKDSLYDIYTLNKKTGVSWSKTSKNIVDNLKLAQKYNFKGGLENMMEMTVWANKMKVNLQTIGSIAEKISNPEGVIETAARLQVLGGQFSSMANPFQMLYESLEDVGGLAQRVEKMFGNLGVFDKNLGQVTISGPDRIRIRAAAESMGMAYDEAIEIINNKARRTAIQQQLKFNSTLSEENKDFIETLAQWNNKNKSFEIRTFNEEKQTYETKNINKLTNDEIEKLRLEPDDDIKKLVDRTFSINKKAEMIEKTTQSILAASQDGFRDTIITTFSTTSNIISRMEWIGGTITSIAGMLALMKLSMAAKGAVKMFKGAKNIYGSQVNGNGNSQLGSSKFSKIKPFAKGAGMFAAGAAIGGVTSYINSSFDVNDLKNERNALIKSGAISEGSERDKEYIDRIKHAEKLRSAKSLGTAIGSGIGSLLYLVPGAGTVFGSIGSVGGGIAGSMIGDAIVGDYEKIDDGIVSNNKVIQTNKDDSAVFAKNNGPFDKLFGNIIPKIENLNDYVKKTNNNGILSDYKQFKTVFDTNNTYNKKNSLKRLIFEENNENNIDNIKNVIDKSYKNDLSSITNKIIDVKPIGDNVENINQLREIIYKKENSVDNRELNIKPIDININGSLKLDVGNKNIDILNELKDNPIFLRELTKLLVTEMSNSIFGGKPKLNQNRFAKF